MKNIFKTLAVLILIQVAFASAYQAIGQDKKVKGKTETMKCWTSMTCEKCVAKIEKNIPFEKGVTDLQVDLPTKMVTITYKPEKTSPEKLEKALKKLGYKTEIVTDK
jgi:periplasmic mercuric ion binding protein